MFILVRGLVWATLFVAFGLVFVPGRILARAGILAPAGTGPMQLAGIGLVLAGGALVLSAILTFAFLGRGTAAPFDPPRRLVTGGPFRYVRNPIYIGALVAMAGAAAYYRSLGLLIYGAVLTVGFHLLVLVYEEPTLRRVFGESYIAYCRQVPRWLPRRPRPTG